MKNLLNLLRLKCQLLNVQFSVSTVDCIIGSYTIASADARCGRRFAVVKILENGAISPQSSYLSESNLTAYILEHFNPRLTT